MAQHILNKEISVQDLVKGVEFEVDENGNYLSDDNFDVTFDKDSELLAEYDDSVKPRFVTGVAIPFSQLKSRMTPVSDDGLVFKEILKQGVGSPIPDKSVVYIHYDSILEGQKRAFLSNRDGEPFKFLFGGRMVPPGLEIGIQTMKKDEISRILVFPKYAPGEMGRLARSPPIAEILYEVQVVKFRPLKDETEFPEWPPKDMKNQVLKYRPLKDETEFPEWPPKEIKQSPFEELIEVYQRENSLANEGFRKKSFEKAIARYGHIADILEVALVSNEEEDEQLNGCLVKLYLNISQCFLNLQEPRRAIIYAEFALGIDSNNLKGLYRMGRALYLTGSYKRAGYYLYKAKSFKPYDKSINEAIKELESKCTVVVDLERMMESLQSGKLGRF